IRIHKNELPSPSSIGNNGVVDVITNEQPSETTVEKNIFISLVAKKYSEIPISLEGQTLVRVDAYNNTKSTPIDSDSFDQTIGMAHDPNWIKSMVLTCFRFKNSEQIREEKISYVLHFENTGQGFVDSCKAELV
ncbi:hypothetical protein, partial [Rhizobium leguminosarum]|uniref:hypothetical protein n=1 Tax=Rhizobium leguminosarum TaxID=384 RepID=UPI003F98EBDE